MQCGQQIDIYADSEKNLFFLTKSRNPDYDEAVEAKRQEEWDRLYAEKNGFGMLPFPPDMEFQYLTAKVVFELRYPYTVSDIVETFQIALNAWNQYPVHMDKKRDPVELYSGIKSFRKASMDKRYIRAGVSDMGYVGVRLSLPLKTNRAWMMIENSELEDDVDLYRFAEAIFEYATKDLSEFPKYSVYRSKLNVST